MSFYLTSAYTYFIKSVDCTQIYYGLYQCCGSESSPIRDLLVRSDPDPD
jgi:hypothetical protein